MPLLAGRYAVIGAGHGGQAVAAYLAHRGFRVSLFNKSFERIRPILRENGVHLAGVVQDFARLDLVTTDIAQAVAGARVVMVVVPASAHRAIAYRLAPHLRDGQIVVLHPGRTGGAFEFRHALERAGSRAAVTIVEAQTFLFASRITGPARVTIHGVKQRVPVAALPASDTPAAVAILERAFPQFVPATSVLETSFDNIGAIFHPGPTLLNAARIEATGGDFDYYHEGITPAIALVLEQLDAERLAVAQAYGVRGTAAKDWVRMAYGCEGADLYEVIQNNSGYRGIKAPASLHHRYLFEDVPTSLVPLAAFGALAGVATPTFDMLIDLAERLTGRDYRAIGRTPERMGLAGWRVDEIIAWALAGRERVELTG